MYIKAVYIEYEMLRDGSFNLIYHSKDGSKNTAKKVDVSADLDVESKSVLEQNIDNAYTFKITFNKTGYSFYWVSTERQ